MHHRLVYDSRAAMEEATYVNSTEAVTQVELNYENDENAEEYREKKLQEARLNSARRLANESPEQRAKRLTKLADYSRRRIAMETPDQRQERLRRMAEYSARRIATETGEQRAARLAQMREYARRRRLRTLDTVHAQRLRLPHLKADDADAECEASPSILEPEVIYCEDAS